MLGKTVYFFLAYCFLHFICQARASSVATVHDEAGFVSALKTGVEIIVVKEHLDLFCARPEAFDLKQAEKDCDSPFLPYDLRILRPSTRAIVVRSMGLSSVSWAHAGSSANA
jgi:hypothetical protein